MNEIPQSLFDVYALALPHGHGFGARPPVSAWQSADSNACGIVTRDVNTGIFGILVMRRRVDKVWTITADEQGISNLNGARTRVKLFLKEGAPLEPMPKNTASRPGLYDLKGRTPSEVFRLFLKPSHHIAAWMLNQIYLAIPNPDVNWAGDCQTCNTHTRLWEAQLLACFREQGLFITQPYPSPDFKIENRLGKEAWIEAVTANPSAPYNHVGSEPSKPPEDVKERLLGSAAVRFAKTLGNKLQRRYDQYPHVENKPFVIALADFHAPSSMIWSREALISYLYGMFPEVLKVEGRGIASAASVSHLLGPTGFQAGLFRKNEHSWLSAVIFSNACSIAKFNRVGVSAGAIAKGLRYVRIGEFFDRTPGAIVGVPFCLDITSADYRALWPQGYEPWSAELEVFHNPYARHPLPRELVPEATHWCEDDREIICEAYYETSILWSKTIIQNETDEMPKFDDFQFRSDVET